MAANAVDDFAKYLVSKNYIAGGLISKLDLPSGVGQAVRRLWELTDLSANDFADEVARFYGVRRISLAELMDAAPLVAQFSRRFLREMTVFPFAAGGGAFGLAVADPVDSAPVRAAEIVLGGPVKVVIASFEDIVTVLTACLGDDDLMPADVAEAG